MVMKLVKTGQVLIRVKQVHGNIDTFIWIINMLMESQKIEFSAKCELSHINNIHGFKVKESDGAIYFNFDLDRIDIAIVIFQVLQIGGRLGCL